MASRILYYRDCSEFLHIAHFKYCTDSEEFYITVEWVVLTCNQPQRESRVTGSLRPDRQRATAVCSVAKAS